MADPDRKINLDIPSDDSEELELDPSDVSLVKEFEEEFGNRFTDEDVIFTEFCKQKPKPPPIVYPFDGFHNQRGGHRGGGRFQHYGAHRHNFDNPRGFEHGQRDNQRHDQRRYYNNRHDNDQQHGHGQNKRPRTDSYQPEGP